MSSNKKVLTNRKLLAVFFVQLNEAYQISVLLPIVVFMCRDFGIQPQWLGVYTSVLNASFGFCQFLVSYLWGYLSDIYGRRIILLCGLMGTFASMIVFGFSTSYEMALIARCLTGFFNGNLGVVKAYLADITDSSNRGFAFSIIGVSFGAGIILGSLLGGILIVTHNVDVPDEEYIKTTSLLKWSIFEYEFPFLLPTAVLGGIIAFNALTWTIINIHNEKQQISAYANKSDKSDLLSIKSESDIDIEMTSNLVFNTKNDNNKLIRQQNEYLAHHQSLPTLNEFNSMLTKFEPDQIKLLSNLRESRTIDDFAAIDIYSISSVTDLIKYTYLGHGLLMYGIAAISHMMFKEMGPVFMAQALMFNSTFIGISQAWSGSILFFFTLFVQPVCLRRFNHRIITMMYAIATSLCMVLMPSTYWFTLVNNPDYEYMNDKWYLLAMVLIVEGIITCTVSIVFVVATCWLNNSVPNVHVGKANGVGQTLAAFVRGFGPLLTGFIWSESFVQIEDNNTHYAVYYAYLPGVLFYCVMVFDVFFNIPSNLQDTWEQRETDNMKK